MHALLTTSLLLMAGGVSLHAQHSKQIDVKNLFPQVGAIIVVAEANNFGVPQGILGACSGTLIHPRVFLTAGHCTRPSEAGLPPFIHVYVTFNLHVFDDRSNWIPVIAQAWHPSTLPCPNQTCNWPPPPIPGLSDIGLVLLRDSVAGIKPAKLANPGALETGRGESQPQIIVGYGFTEPAPAGGRPPWSQWEGIRRYHLKSLDRVLDERSAQWELPGNICFVDSGGPVFFGPVSESGTKRRTIVATVAAGGGDCKSLSYHMRVDNEEVQSWIEGQIQQFLKTHP